MVVNKGTERAPSARRSSARRAARCPNPGSQSACNSRPHRSSMEPPIRDAAAARGEDHARTLRGKVLPSDERREIGIADTVAHNVSGVEGWIRASEHVKEKDALGEGLSPAIDGRQWTGRETPALGESERPHRFRRFRRGAIRARILRI